MAFQPDDYIYHKGYGVGKIVSVTEGPNSEASIHFKPGSLTSLPIYLLDRNASKLSPEGFHVYAFLDPDSAHTLLRDDPVEAICRVLEDFPGYKAKTEDLQDYLTQYLPDWDPWWQITQPKLKQDVRIDTSKSKFREYGIQREVLTKAGEAYLSFRRLRNFEDTTRVYTQALQVLREIQRNSELPEKDQAELLAYLKGIILSPNTPIAIRFEALFHLHDGKYILDEDFTSLINRLIDEKFRLYDLGQYALNHLLDVLLSRSLNDHELDLLATGMCTRKDVIGKLVDWALARADPQIVSVFLITALSENVKNALDQKNKDKDFLARLNGCVSLVRGMTQTSNMWPKIFASFDQMVEVLAGNYPVTEIHYLLPGLVRLATELHARVGIVMESDPDAVLKAMANPGVRLEFILACLDIDDKNNSTKHYASDLEAYLLDNADRRSLDIIKPLISRKNLTFIEQATELTQLIKSFPNSQYIFNKVEQLLCKLGTQATDSELLALQPYLDIFHDSSSVSSGNTRIENLREQAFIVLFEADFSQIESTQHPLDLALRAAVRKYLKTQMANAERKIISERQTNQKLKSQIQELDHLLREKEKLLHELRSTHGSDTRAAYFEERTRILGDLVSTVAEFERFVASHPTRSNEIDAILRRLSNLISAHKVSPLEDINSQVPFNPQKHRLAEGTSVSIDDPVIVLERGYVIRDHKGKLRLLKPAIVKSLDQDELGR